MKGKKKNMKLSTNKTTNTVITMILMFAITFSLFIAAAPPVSAQQMLNMNHPGQNGVTYNIVLHQTVDLEFDNPTQAYDNTTCLLYTSPSPRDRS